MTDVGKREGTYINRERERERQQREITMTSSHISGKPADDHRTACFVDEAGITCWSSCRSLLINCISREAFWRIVSIQILMSCWGRWNIAVADLSYGACLSAFVILFKKKLNGGGERGQLRGGYILVWDRARQGPSVYVITFLVCEFMRRATRWPSLGNDQANSVAAAWEETFGLSSDVYF